jgi:hypothetical protein
MTDVRVAPPKYLDPKIRQHFILNKEALFPISPLGFVLNRCNPWYPDKLHLLKYQKEQVKVYRACLDPM